MIGLIWGQALDAAGRPVIGAGNTIPWRVPEDFAHFKRITSGHPVVMGRLTWESLPRRPLPGRTNIVITRTGTLPDDDAVVTRSLDEALAVAAQAPGGDEVWVMGGGRVYADALGLADRLEVTEVDLVVEGDAFAPALDPALWRAVREGEWATSSSGVRYRHLTYLPAR
ncbi:dihydrofolate reductase [Antribacter gilvus]|uniref:dihydrofolate reductase n=1 Tax=Antribacter gilvus TaxID=2304675 RepID=UPI000F78320E|nr:dihydrofolate reductase [Antribacter gilvus]